MGMTVPAVSGDAPTGVSLWSRLRAALPEGRENPEAVWRSRHRVVVIFVVVHAVGLTAFGMARGWGPAFSFGEGGLLAALAALAAWPRLGRRFRSSVAALGCVTASAVLTQFWGGVIEAHFHYFVVVALISLYQDWVPFLLAILYVAVDHGAIGTLAPTWVYNHPDGLAHPWRWALIHATFVLAECAILVAAWKSNERAREETDEVLRSAGEAILGVDDTGHVTFANPAAAAMTGLRQADLVGVPVSQIVSDVRGRPLALGTTVLAGTEARVRSVPVQALVTPIVKPGGTRASVVSLTDVSELKAAETRVKEIVEHSTNLFYAHTVENVLTYVSPQSQLFLGCSPEEARVHWTEFATDNPLNSEGEARTKKAIETGLAQPPYELELRARDGRLLRVEVNETPVVKDGKVVGMVGSLTDVTDRRRAEEARLQAEADLRRLNEDLERRIAARTYDLQAANKELEAFSYSVSHDLRAPLRSIDGFSKAVLDDHGPSLPEEARHQLTRVRDNTQKMAGLIDDMLQLSRVTRTEIRKEKVDLSTMVAVLVDDLRRRDPHRQVDLHVPPGIKAVCDPRLMGIALTNLLENAWKFTSHHPRAVIEFGETKGPDGARAYFIRDDGAGFEMAYANKLFTAFQRLHAASEFEGTGVGLATVHRIVTKHGGRVWAEGAPEKGATFWFTIEGDRTA